MLLEQYAKDDLILIKRPHAHIVVGNKLCDIWLLDTKSQSFHHCFTASLRTQTHGPLLYRRKNVHQPSR